MYKISIIIPVFNVEDYLDNAFQSIYNQTFDFEDIEIIFIDDNSTDNSLEIIEKYAKKYRNVISIHLDTNSGTAGKPRNIGMSHATADYIMFLDPDDLFTDDACEILYDEILKEDCDIVTGVHTVDGINVYPNLLLNTLTNPNEDMDTRFEQVNKIIHDSDFSIKLNSIDDYPSFIANSNIWTKIFRKSLIENNNIKFPEKIPAEDSVFLLNAILNAKGIKFINKIVYKYKIDRNDSVSHKFSEELLLNRLKAYYEMYYICANKNKTKIFKQYLLFDKLIYFLVTQLLKSDLTVNELLNVLIFAQPLFKSYVNYNNNIKSHLANLFKYIAHKEYDKVIEIIYGNAPRQEDLIIATNLNNIPTNNTSCFNLINILEYDLNQIEKQKFDLFLYIDSEHEENESKLENKQKLSIAKIIECFNEKNIPTVLFKENNDNKSNNRNFNFILTNDNNLKNSQNNVMYLNENEFDEKISKLELTGDEYYSISNNNTIIKILDEIHFKYIPRLQHIILFYELNNLKDLNRIYEHFYSINYPYKHIKIITDENNLFLNDSILKHDIWKINMPKNCFFSFIDFKFDPNTIKKAIYVNTNENIKNNEHIINKIFKGNEFKDIINILFKQENY